MKPTENGQNTRYIANQKGLNDQNKMVKKNQNGHIRSDHNSLNRIKSLIDICRKSQTTPTKRD